MSGENLNKENLNASANKVAGNIQEIATNMKDKASSLGQELKEQACATGETIKTGAIDLGNKIVETVQAHPYRSLAIAFMLGMLCGHNRRHN